MIMLERLDVKEFDAFAKEHSLSSFFQSSYWGKLKEHNGWKMHLVGIKENDNIVAASLLLSKKINFINKNIFYAPRGFLLDYENRDMIKTFCEEVKKYVKKEKGIFIKINPFIPFRERDVNGDIVDNLRTNKELVEYLCSLGYEHIGFGEDVPNMEPRFISVLNLENKNEEDLLKDMRATTRWSIKNSYRNKLRVIEASEKDLVKFKELMKHTSERRGFIDRPLSYYQNMYNEFKKSGNIKVLLVELDCNEQIEMYKEKIDNLTSKLEHEENLKRKKEGTIKELTSQLESAKKQLEVIKEQKKEYGSKVIIAGGLYMLFGKQVIYLFGASLKPFMKYNSQYLLQWEMIKYSLENHYQNFNFYGIEPAFHQDDPMYGLFDFKRGFNAIPVELIGEFNCVVDKKAYKTYNFMLRVYKLLRKVRN